MQLPPNHTTPLHEILLAQNCPGDSVLGICRARFVAGAVFYDPGDEPGGELLGRFVAAVSPCVTLGSALAGGMEFKEKSVFNSWTLDLRDLVSSCGSTSHARPVYTGAGGPIQLSQLA